MGYNLALNLLQHEYTVGAHDRSAELSDKFGQEPGASSFGDLAGLCTFFSGRKVIWVMVPAGEAVDAVIQDLLPQLSPGDILIDGGNSHFKDSVRRAEFLKKNEIGFLDCGTSGGISGALHGACTMVGGDPETYAVRADRELLVCDPASVLPMAQRYFLF